MTKQKTLAEKLAEIKEGDLVRVVYKKRKSINSRSGYAFKNDYGNDPRLNIYSEYSYRDGCLRRAGPNMCPSLTYDKILKVEVLKKRVEVESELENLFNSRGKR